MSTFVSHSTEETEAFACRFAEGLRSGDVLALFGGLGMGKTAFVRGLAQGLGSTSEVSSPTFALVHEYDGRLPIFHFDMYRISGLDDLYSTGFFEYLESGGIVVIEWSENIEPYLPPETKRIRIDRTDGAAENERRLTIENEDSGD
ncbi:MAG: tRNA (adenosine(37)-N6)-threonylcarbamoyltransferase complex ATPase subunit type 1 TsaE [Clostridia bacterium]|nr:tRNA (adenosine(37)-N6)-threonylcarbamoyltransferase complex ATPase subunit type 1 TsaE [Clostridia bacterium]